MHKALGATHVLCMAVMTAESTGLCPRPEHRIDAYRVTMLQLSIDQAAAVLRSTPATEGHLERCGASNVPVCWRSWACA